MRKRTTVDLSEVRGARRRLHRLAREHPELLGVSGRENRAGWESIIEEDEVGNTKQYTFRLPDELIARLDAFAERLARDTGLEVSRADVVKKLLQDGLAAADGEPKKRKP